MSREQTAPGHSVTIGLGLMGRDIAAIFLAGGWRVTAVEPAGGLTPERRERVQGSLGQFEADPDAVAAMTTAERLDAVDFAMAAVVVEAAPERLELKRAIFTGRECLVPPGVPVASNASGLRITDIARDCVTRTRMANLHFFLPAHLVPGVEVVQGECTDPALCDRLAAIMTGLGRKPIRVARDVPGFLANRIQNALMREAFAVIDQGLATAEDVDAAVRYAFGFRYLAAGPILQKELAGLETQLAAARTIYPSLCNDTAPSATLERLVAAGRLGAIEQARRDPGSITVGADGPLSDDHPAVYAPEAATGGEVHLHPPFRRRTGGRVRAAARDLPRGVRDRHGEARVHGGGEAPAAHPGRARVGDAFGEIMRQTQQSVQDLLQLFKAGGYLERPDRQPAGAARLRRRVTRAAPPASSGDVPHASHPCQAGRRRSRRACADRAGRPRLLRDCRLSGARRDLTALDALRAVVLSVVLRVQSLLRPPAVPDETAEQEGVQ